MRFERIEADGFGPHTDTLELAPGLNLLYGANEAGKSSWLAALYALLCGIRRGKGQPKREDQEFASRFRPWPPVPGWKVRGIIALHDGRRIRLDRDLGEGVDVVCDEVTRESLEDTILTDRAPDGARWLGLNRTAFRAVAFVAQASISAILDVAESLQDELQSAAQSARSEGTAARAMDRLKQFQKEAVGQDRKGATKPLRAALGNLERNKRDLEEERQRRDQWDSLQVKVREADSEADAARRDLLRAQANATAMRASELEEKASRATALHERQPTAPAPLADEPDRLHEAERVLALWEQRPAPAGLTGQTAAGIRDEIERLPPMPVGDLRPHGTVNAAWDRHKQAQHALPQAAPPHVEAAPRDDVFPSELRRLATDLETEVPAIDASLQHRLDAERQRLEAALQRTTPRSLPRTAGLALVAAGILLMVLSYPIPGAASFAAGMLILVAGQRRLTSAAKAAAHAQRIISEYEPQIVPKVAAANHAQSIIQNATTACVQNDLEPAPTALRDLAVRIERHEERLQERRQWDIARASLEAAVHEAEEAVRAALQARGMQGTEVGDVAPIHQAYISACDRRSDEASLAARKPDLEKTLKLREDAEGQAAKAAHDRTIAEHAVLEAAARCEKPASTAEEAAATLRSHCDAIRSRLEAHSKAISDWNVLQTLLEGATLEDLRQRAEAARREADGLARSVRGSGRGGAPLPRETVQQLERRVEEAGSRAASLRGQLEERARQLQSLAELEEQVTVAEAELERVERLDRTIETTLKFLGAAEDDIHHRIAPRLTEELTRRLPRVTANHYVEANVAPESLSVQVRERDTREWRDATDLSHGTREQVFLLLRTALADYLTRPPEKCPLLLDEVTAYCDTERATEVLNTLLDLSGERQIILCSHEERVLRWARGQMRGCRIIEL
ncbi:MAG: AAA family ATPase [Longimicrobiales bacterium]